MINRPVALSPGNTIIARRAIHSLKAAALQIADLSRDAVQMKRSQRELYGLEFDQVFMILASAKAPPTIRLGRDVDIFSPRMRTCIIQDAYTGLMAAYNEDEAVVIGNKHFLTGQFVLFQCDPWGYPVSVTPQEFIDVSEVYRQVRGTLKVGASVVETVRLCSV